MEVARLDEEEGLGTVLEACCHGRRGPRTKKRCKTMLEVGKRQTCHASVGGGERIYA